jgi:hypothetical protein
MVTRFRGDCTNYEERRDIDGTSLCTMNHTPEKGCDPFKSRIAKLSVTRQNNDMKSVLLVSCVAGTLLSDGFCSQMRGDM